MNMMKCPSFDPSETCSVYFFLFYYLHVQLTYGCFMPSSVINTQLLIGSKLTFRKFPHWKILHTGTCTNRQRETDWYCIVDVWWSEKIFKHLRNMSGKIVSSELPFAPEHSTKQLAYKNCITDKEVHPRHIDPRKITFLSFIQHSTVISGMKIKITSLLWKHTTV